MIRIRASRAADAERLDELMHTSAAYQGRYASILVGYRVTPAYLERTPTWVAVDSAGIIGGFASLQIEPPEIDLMFVSDELQGSGIGRELVVRLLDDAVRRGLARLRVVAHPAAEGFYRRLGAERIGAVPPSPPRVTWERPELVFRLGPEVSATGVSG